MARGFDRRRFLTGSAVTAFGLTAAAAPANAAGPPTREERWRAVVVGSGFGGGVAALRLAEAGVRTLVLERGRRWEAGPGSDTFPRFFHPDRRVSWLKPHPVFPASPPALFRPYTGVIERVRGQGMDIICGAGVGGSSLAYAGMSLRPNAELFARVMPSGVDYDEMDRVFYPRVAAMLRLTAIPDDVLDHVRYTSTRLFLEHARRAGLRAERVPLPVDWEDVRRELRGEVPASMSTGDVIYGVNNSGKHSVDRTYLAAAERTGRVTVAPLHVVRDIRRDNANRYVVRCDRINTDGEVLEHVVVTADALFLGAGSAGTSRLLVRARGTGAMPDLPDDVGGHWGNNGDRLYLRHLVPQPTNPPQGGPACSAILDWSNPAGPVSVEHGPAPLPVELRTMAMLGMGIPDGHGRFHYDGRADEVVLRWPVSADQRSREAVRSTLDRLVRATGGTLVDLNALDPFTFHPLGGAVLGRVCDLDGRVLDHPGLYVVDAALIPGSTGCCNPSWTVAALAERCLSRIVAQDVGTVF
ncbi:cholesterol oxidase [Streptoalloteichus tenebrarius]|uniref:Cholesterol oxidase n=1 Tax=Streptoalloteichus tenebrarius (strain ATCC 17920 / DSM 40477 / JCM 4838 / CBS 697.72 / NBRC 16177 / NCIMB 11028 / NRRL B-12390 / A12253. 1 / ISP 5477) TaxID=1933 RepID=A0ABT1HWK4_STRSD|nr:GMC oxidoreductase [Streptoalloteichus tenebrarius]MCP2259902.1 cholesterol oxidase [Streptoalloteichus tenebrarius]BFF03227.1 GMC oxidoreductase [Streptoalloteichus tenebrarius]